MIPEARNREVNIRKRYEYANAYLALNEQRVIFVDEIGVNCSMRCNYGRSMVGMSPRKIVRSLRSKNYSISSAINKDGILFFKTIDQPYNRDRYGDFLDGLLAVLKEKNLVNSILIMDNCIIHKVNFVKEKILQAGHSAIFLPPYPPELNPIEELFSKWKYGVKNANIEGVEQLHEAILNAHNEITREDRSGYFEHMREFPLKAVRRDES